MSSFFAWFTATEWSPVISYAYIFLNEVRNSRVTKSSYKTDLCKMTSHFELLTRTFLWKLFFRVTNLTS